MVCIVISIHILFYPIVLKYEFYGGETSNMSITGCPISSVVFIVSVSVFIARFYYRHVIYEIRLFDLYIQVLIHNSYPIGPV